MTDNLRRAYLSQRSNARHRGIAWKFTYDAWLQVWEASGLLELRGQGTDRYCMARFKDCGPYSPENVRIITNQENRQEFHDMVRNGERERKNPEVIPVEPFTPKEAIEFLRSEIKLSDREIGLFTNASQSSISKIRRSTRQPSWTLGKALVDLAKRKALK